MAARLRLGIITGSGPEAGLDLWGRLLRHNRRLLPGVRGDVDAPAVVILSNPVLGLPKESANAPLIRAALAQSAAEAATMTDVFTLACNTLHTHADVIRDTIAGLPRDARRGRFLSFVDIAKQHVRDMGASRVALLGTLTVTDMSTSPYASLVADGVQVELPSDRHALQSLIMKVKRLGAENLSESDVSDWTTLLSRLTAPVVLLACTELPLVMARLSPQVRRSLPPATVVDFADVVAESLLRASWDAPYVRDAARATENV